MLTPQLGLDVHNELIIDNFAGGGGASCGIELALGRSVDAAINHDPEAVAMHAMNHPQTRHYCESVWDVDPLEVTQGRPVGLAWFSPDCKHFSKAKGSKPRDKKIRGLAWIVLRWAALVRPRVIMLENVEEFKTWGPLLDDGNPCPKRKGDTFRSFIHQLQEKGYAVEHRELRACDYGAPIVWPDPTHGAPGSAGVQAGALTPWRTAAECIDWSLFARAIEREAVLADRAKAMPDAEWEKECLRALDAIESGRFDEGSSTGRDGQLAAEQANCDSRHLRKLLKRRIASAKDAQPVGYVVQFQSGDFYRDYEDKIAFFEAPGSGYDSDYQASAVDVSLYVLAVDKTRNLQSHPVDKSANLQSQPPQPPTSAPEGKP